MFSYKKKLKNLNNNEECENEKEINFDKRYMIIRKYKNAYIGLYIDYEKGNLFDFYNLDGDKFLSLRSTKNEMILFKDIDMSNPDIIVVNSNKLQPNWAYKPHTNYYTYNGTCINDVLNDKLNINGDYELVSNENKNLVFTNNNDVITYSTESNKVTNIYFGNDSSEM